MMAPDCDEPECASCVAWREMTRCEGSPCRREDFPGHAAATWPARTDPAALTAWASAEITEVSDQQSIEVKLSEDGRVVAAWAHEPMRPAPAVGEPVDVNAEHSVIRRRDGFVGVLLLVAPHEVSGDEDEGKEHAVLADSRTASLWARSSDFMTARRYPNGALQFEGQDLSGDDEYEYALTVKAEAVPQLLAALGMDAMSDPLEVLLGHSKEIDALGVSRWLNSLGIEASFWSRGTAPFPAEG